MPCFCVNWCRAHRNLNYFHPVWTCASLLYWCVCVCQCPQLVVFITFLSHILCVFTFLFRFLLLFLFHFSDSRPQILLACLCLRPDLLVSWVAVTSVTLFFCLFYFVDISFCCSKLTIFHFCLEKIITFLSNLTFRSLFVDCLHYLCAFVFFLTLFYCFVFVHLTPNNTVNSSLALDSAFDSPRQNLENASGENVREWERKRSSVLNSV